MTVKGGIGVYIPKPKSDQEHILAVWDKFTAGKLTPKEILRDV